MKRCGLVQVLAVNICLTGLFCTFTARPVQAALSEPPEYILESGFFDETLTADSAYNFFFICPILGNPYWEEYEAGIREADEWFGVNTEIIGPEELDEEKRFQCFREAVACRADGIFLAPFTEEAYAAEVSRISEEIPVTYMEGDIRSKASAFTPSVTVIGIDNYEAGFLLGQTAVNRLKSGRIGVLTGGTELENIRLRLQGILDAADQAEDIEIAAVLSSEASMELGMMQCEILLDQYQADAIIGTSATDVLAAARICKQRESGTLLFGFDRLDATVRYIEEGVVYGTIYQHPRLCGWLGVQSLVQEIQYKEASLGQRIDAGFELIQQGMLYE